ncbi:hypothetical protein PHYC_01259 [Phycisphaerales bacterium]|nr:hypothetical protein PHYC_01259 [Phycisphaerales bacterium]
MLRPSRLLWFTAVVLFLWMLMTTLDGCFHRALLTHATDVDRDAVMGPFYELVEGGAVDLDKAAAVMKIPAYSGTTAGQRKDFDDNVKFKAMFFLTDEVSQRIESGFAGRSLYSFVSAGVCLFAVVMIAVQARRVSALE